MMFTLITAAEAGFRDAPSRRDGYRRRGFSSFVYFNVFFFVLLRVDGKKVGRLYAFCILKNTQTQSRTRNAAREYLVVDTEQRTSVVLFGFRLSVIECYRSNIARCDETKTLKSVGVNGIQRTRAIKADTIKRNNVNTP